MIYTEIIKGDFASQIRNSDSYKDNFSYEGANALQDFIEELSQDTGSDQEFDPIAWCCDWDEYKDLDEFQRETGYVQITDRGGVYVEGYPNIETLEDLNDHTYVIEFDGGIIVKKF